MKCHKIVEQIALHAASTNTRYTTMVRFTGHLIAFSGPQSTASRSRPNRAYLLYIRNNLNDLSIVLYDFDEIFGLVLARKSF